MSCLYGFDLMLYVFHMIIIIRIIIMIIILEMGPYFSNVSSFQILTSFRIINVWPEIPATTDFVRMSRLFSILLFFRIINVWPEPLVHGPWPWFLVQGPGIWFLRNF